MMSTRCWAGPRSARPPDSPVVTFTQNPKNLRSPPLRRVTLADLPRFAREVLSALAENADRFPAKALALLPGLEVSAHFGDGPLGATIANGWSSAGASEPMPGGKRSLRIFVSHPALGAFPETAVWGEQVFDPIEFGRRLEEAGLRGDYHHDLRYWQFYDAETGVGAQLMRDASGFPPWEPGAPLRSFLHWGYAARGMRLAHAGTLGHKGRGVMLVGAGGSGKSGTVLAGLLNGLDSVGDDYVLVGLEGDVAAYPLFRTLKQDRAGWERLGLGARLSLPASLNWQGKYQFHLEDVAVRPLPGRLTMTAMMVPRVSGASRTTIAPMSRKDAAVALTAPGLTQMPGDRTTGFRFFGELTRRLPCYEVLLGTDPKEIAATIGEFIERTDV
jgi:hypothetical protein